MTIHLYVITEACKNTLVQNNLLDSIVYILKKFYFYLILSYHCMASFSNFLVQLDLNYIVN